MNTLFLASVNTDKLLSVLGLVALIAVVFAILIVLVSKLCAVPKNEKAEAIQENLAGANCGGCGYAGCADFAKALAEGKADISKCGPTSAENKAKIAEILEISFANERKIAVVRCNGGNDCSDKFEYVGNDDCKAQATFMNGKKSCSCGCLGGGTCLNNCAYNAILMKDGYARVNGALCEACGICANNCPKGIIGFIPYNAKIFVACSSRDKGKDVMSICKTGCIGCGICSKTCPQQAITMVDNLPVIDYGKCSGCKTCVAKCPRKTIKEIN